MPASLLLMKASSRVDGLDLPKMSNSPLILI